MNIGQRWATQQEAEAKSKVVTDDVLAKHTWNNVITEILIEVLEPQPVLNTILAVL